MKRKILPFILILLTFVNIFAPFSVGLNSKNTPEIQANVAEAGANCAFVKDKTKFIPYGQQADNWISGNPTVLLEINTKDCVGEYFSVSIEEQSGSPNLPVFTAIRNRQLTNNKTVITLVPGEQYCNDKDSDGCQIGFTISLNSKDGKEFDKYTSSSEKKDELYYKCTDNKCKPSTWSERTSAGDQTAQQVAQGTLDQKKADLDNAVKKREAACKAPNGKSQACIDAQEEELKAKRNFDSANTNVRDNTLILDQKKADYDNAVKKREAACTDEASQACIDAKKEELMAKIALNQATPKIDADTLPACNPIPLVGEGTLMGCIAQGIYYVLFVPTSYLFALTGQLFDWAFHYSVSDTAYRSPFVVQGWGLIRDFCNLFFIFVLLYVAISTTLSIHGFKTKEMIINVVVIGLLMNFSLFAAQVIIDTSNILARSIYNSDAIKITNNGANCTTDPTNKWCLDLGQGIDTRPGGIIPLSAALVNKVNPQNLITNGRNAVYIEDKVNGTQSNSTDKGNLGTGAFILVTFLAIAVNIVGMIVFLSVGLMFISRVIGLWLAMIFVPLAFFSYTVPAMKDMSMVGWKHWWPETMKLAFMAPVFIVFLYLIIKFLNSGLDLISADSQTGTAFVIATVVPFVFIMMLLWKAKDITKDMSGKLGQSITGGIATVGGLALGGAALGTAFMGRNIIGRGMAAASKTEGAQKMMKYRQDLKDFNLKKKDSDGNLLHDVEPPKPKIGFVARIGDRLNHSQEKVDEANHGRSKMDGIKDKAHINKDIPDDNLSAVDEKKLKDTYIKEERSTVESEIRAGRAIDATGAPIDSEAEFKNKARAGVTANHSNDVGRAVADFTPEDREVIKNKLNIEFNNYMKEKSTDKLSHDFEHLRKESKDSINPITKIVANSAKGSYDPRNLSQSKADRRDGIFSRMGAGLIAGIAMGVRTGLKSSGINHGSGQADLLKDLGHTITEAMKSAKVTVKVEESHGKSGADSHGGGGGH